MSTVAYRTKHSSAIVSVIFSGLLLDRIICSTSAPFSADISTSIRSELLIHELQRKLHLARSLRLKDMVERWRTDVAVGQPEVRAVQDVKQLCTELELLRFCHFEILERSEVPVGISRTDIHVAAFRAKLPRVGCGIESMVSAGVE